MSRCGREVGVAAVETEQLLNVVARALVHIASVEGDQIGRPLVLGDMTQKRRVASSEDDILYERDQLSPLSSRDRVD